MLFRSMTPNADGLPLVGRSGRQLGVRVPDDIATDERGIVVAGQGGLSVAPCSMDKLPVHRQPRGMRPGSTGKLGDCVYSLDLDALADTCLAVRADPQHPFIHALVEPSEPMALQRYELALGQTRARWKRAWP